MTNSPNFLRTVFLFSFTLFLLATKHIKRFYLCMVSISILLASNYSNSMFINFLRSHTDEINDKLSIFDYELIKASVASYVAQVGSRIWMISSTEL